MKKIALISLLVTSFCQSGNAIICDGEIVDSIRNNLERVLLENSNDPVLEKCNILIPTCSVVNNQKIDFKKIESPALEIARYWLSRYLSVPVWDSLIFLENMAKGDDWIIFNSLNGGVYTQFIDSRSLTIVIRQKVVFQDALEFKKVILNKIKKKITFYGKEFGSHITVEIEKATPAFIRGRFASVKDNIYVTISPDKPQPEFWVNEQYIIVNFPKVHRPYKDMVRYYGWKSIGGIRFNDPRPFIRFSEKNKIDFENELIKEYPWVQDSIDAINLKRLQSF